MAVVIGDKKSVNSSGADIVQFTFNCDEDDKAAAHILLSLGAMGIGANVALMSVILIQKPLRR
jgi:hypothetical protein